MTTEEDGNTLDGVAPETFVPELERLRRATSSALNCSVGPAAMLETLERMARVAHVKLSAQPNAGRPREIEGRQHLSLLARVHGVVRAAVHQQRRAPRGRLLRHDAGSHPRTSRWRCAALAPGERGARARGARRRRRGRADGRRRCRAREKSRMANALARGGFVVSVELVPPRGYPRRRAGRAGAAAQDPRRRPRQHSRRPAASARMSALSAAVLVQQQAGVEPILHYACRDRNLLGMQSDLLGAHAMGVRNLLVVTGDPPQVGDYPDATARVRRRLDRPDQRRGPAQSRLRHRRAAASASRPGFHIGVAANPAALNLDEELRRFALQGRGRRRVRHHPAGVRCRGAPSASSRASRRTRFPILAGVLPLESAAARRIHGQRGAGRHDARRRARADAARRCRRAARAEEGLAIAREIAAEIRPLVRGVQISTAPQGARYGPGRHRRRRGLALTAPAICCHLCHLWPSVASRGWSLWPFCLLFRRRPRYSPVSH